MAAIILASNSSVRASLLRQAYVPFEVMPARIDESMIKQSLKAESVPPRDIADALAEAKAQKVAAKTTKGLVLGADQVLSLNGATFSKPTSPENALDQLKLLRNDKHTLFSAAVIYEDAKPVWRHVGRADLYMRDVSDTWLEGYIDRNWESIRHTVGCYKLEEEGVRLFTRIQGDYFNVLGLPLLEILSYLTLRGTLPS
ncbi:MAG: Maf family protein [Paracoccaceae bacterium]